EIATPGVSVRAVQHDRLLEQSGFSGKGHDLVVDHRRHFAADRGPLLLEWERATATERLHTPDRPTRRDLEPHALRPNGVGALDQAPGQVGGRVVEQMEGVARLRLPGERL